MAFRGMSLNYTTKACLPCLSLSVFTFHGCKSLVLHGFAKPCPLVFKVHRNEIEKAEMEGSVKTLCWVWTF